MIVSFSTSQPFKIWVYLLRPAYESNQDFSLKAPNGFLSSSNVLNEAHFIMLSYKVAFGCLPSTEVKVVTSAALAETPETSSSKDFGEAVDRPRNHDLALT